MACSGRGKRGRMAADRPTARRLKVERSLACIFQLACKGGNDEMIIIGEKLNGTIKSVGEAIAKKDSEFIRNLAIRQANAGANFWMYAPEPAKLEVDTLKWMVDSFQDAVETPIYIDNPNPNTLAQLIPYLKKPGLINSVSGGGASARSYSPGERVRLRCNRSDH